MEDKLKFAAEQWKIGSLSAVYQRPEKAVFVGQSRRFGPVILKIDRDCAQLRSEYRMLSRLSGAHCCRVYDFREDMGLLLTERILPGIPLRREPSLDARIDAFCRIFQQIHTPAESGESYLDWLDRICQSCKQLPAAAQLSEEASLAWNFCREMFEKYPQRLLLHGDLHHDNLLLRADGSYVMIDPKGVIGPAILDLPRFLLNEQGDSAHINRCISLLEAKLSYPAEDIRKLYFMEAVLANVWHAEDGEPIRWEAVQLAHQVLGRNC